MSPLPSELTEKLNSLRNVGVMVLVRLRAAVRLGRDQRAWKRPRELSWKGSLNVHGTWVPRKLMRWAEERM